MSAEKTDTNKKQYFIREVTGRYHCTTTAIDHEGNITKKQEGPYNTRRVRQWITENLIPLRKERVRILVASPDARGTLERILYEHNIKQKEKQ